MTKLAGTIAIAIKGTSLRVETGLKEIFVRQSIQAVATTTLRPVSALLARTRTKRLKKVNAFDYSSHYEQSFHID